jgi:putative DNA primase/helicase
MTLLAIEAAFRDAAARRGLIIRKLLADGRLHRCDAEGRGGQGDAAYQLHVDGIPNGGFQNWRDGLGWQAWRADVAAILTPGERAELKAKAERQRQEREAERATEAVEAARRAAYFWSRGREPDPAHLYLRHKKITAPPGVRQLGERLLVPMKDAGGRLLSLQLSIA